MRLQMIVTALFLAAVALGGCSMSPAPEGVLPRTSVPPPPSVSSNTPLRQPTATGATVQQRRGLDVPSRLVPPRPSSAH